MEKKNSIENSRKIKEYIEKTLMPLAKEMHASLSHLL
jgi:hypothetical protein